MARSVPVYHVEYAFQLGKKWGPQVIVTRDPGEAEGQAKLRRASLSARVEAVSA